MGFDNSMGRGVCKEHRKPYRDSRAIDRTCRSHGTCQYCVDNRLFFDRKKRLVADSYLKNYKLWKEGE